MTSHVPVVARLTGLLVVCGSSFSLAANPPARPANPSAAPVDPAALVQQVGDTLRDAKSLRVEVTAAGPINMQGRKQPATLRYLAALTRPGKIALVQKTALPAQTIVCDGKHYYTLDPAMPAWSQRSAPSLPNEAVGNELAQAGNGAGLVLGWALDADPGQVISKNTSGVAYKGTDATAGARCHRLQFSQGDWTRDMWVEAAGKPLIRRITFSRTSPQAGAAPSKPELTLTFANWSLDTDLPAETFQFTPPTGVRQVAASDMQLIMKYPAYGLKGQPAPAVMLPLLGGGQLNLAKLKGSTVVLDFWATWCPPCRAGLPALDQLARQYKDKGVCVYAINCDEPAEKVRPFVTSTKLELPVAMDAGKAVGRRYGVRGIPETVIIDKEGVVRWVCVGLPGGGEAAYKAALDAILAGKDLAGETPPQAGEVSTGQDDE